MFKKCRKTLKKGFTLVELIVVIAIIAILAAVSAVSYIAFINKANLSADQQAVTQLNTALQASEAVKKPTNMKEVYEIFRENGMDAEKYKPLTANTYFFWDANQNRIVYTDSTYTVTFPESMKGQTKVNGYFTLSGEIKKENYVVGNNIATVTNAEQLYKVSADISNNANITTINVSGDIDLAGAELKFSDSSNKARKSLTIDGGTNGCTISNAVNSGERYPNNNKEYGASIFGQLLTTNAISIKNLTIDGVCFGSLKSGVTGILFDSIGKDATINLDNVTVKNSKVYGQNKVGIVCGATHNSLTIGSNKLKIDNCEVITSECEAGVFGFVYAQSTGTNGMFGTLESPKNSINNVEITNTKTTFELDSDHHIIEEGGKKYVTKWDSGEAVRTTKVENNEEVVRLCIVNSEKSLFTIGNSTKPFGETQKLLETKFNNLRCGVVYGEKEVLFK